MRNTGGHELGKLANNSPRPCQLDRLDSWLHLDMLALADA